MAPRRWRLSWSTPGQSELVQPVLDFRVNRNLFVGGSAHIKGDLQLDGKMFPWQPYTPTLIGYQGQQGAGANPPRPATGIVYTAIGRYARIGYSVAFEFTVTITARGANWVSNPYVSLPLIWNSQFTAIVAIQGANNTYDSLCQSIFGVAKANSTQIMLVPTGTTTAAIVLLSAYTPVPYQYTCSGIYETV
jgi:hypothetical protein